MNYYKVTRSSCFTELLHIVLRLWILLGNVPATWNVVPSLETVQKVTTDHVSSPKTEVTGIDKGLQTSDTKMSTKIVERTSLAEAPRERRFDFMVENIGNDARFPKIKDADFVKEMTIETVSPLPKNVVLIIAESGQNQEDFWKNFKTSHVFSVEGMLQVWFCVSGNKILIYKFNGYCVHWSK